MAKTLLPWPAIGKAKTNHLWSEESTTKILRAQRHLEAAAVRLYMVNHLQTNRCKKWRVQTLVREARTTGAIDSRRCLLRSMGLILISTIVDHGRGKSRRRPTRGTSLTHRIIAITVGIEWVICQTRIFIMVPYRATNPNSMVQPTHRDSRLNPVKVVWTRITSANSHSNGNRTKDGTCMASPKCHMRVSPWSRRIKM